MKTSECPDCGGYGSIDQREQTGEVSREMARDGGDASLEGQPIFENVSRPCERCGGGGVVETPNQDTPGPFLVFAEDKYCRTLDTEQECRDFATVAEQKTGGNVRVTWVSVRIAKAAPELLTALSEAVDAVVFMSGSSDFSPGGQAHEGWLKTRAQMDPWFGAIAKATGQEVAR